MKKVYLTSLGCSKNLSDSEDIMGLLRAQNYELEFKPEKADLLVVNTCGFLKSAIKESEEEIRRLIKIKKTGKRKKLIVAGCAVERLKKSLFKKFPSADAFVGTNALGDIVKSVKSGGIFLNDGPKKARISPFKYRLTASHSAYVKIAEGCDNICSYCVIPLIKGRYRSKPEKEIIAETEALVKSGAKEISLLAQDTTNYGIDLPEKPSLAALIKKLVRIKNLKWLRLMYVYPDRINSELLKMIRDEKKICEYLDMPVQHASDKILKAMNRRSFRTLLENKIRQIRKIVPNISLRANFLVGFPGETEKDFKILSDFIKKFEFDYAGFFAYSREKGAKAFDMPGQISEKTKIRRVNELIKIQSRIADKKNSKLKGRTVELLMDGENIGRSGGQAPDIDGYFYVQSEKTVKSGSFIKARIIGFDGYEGKAARTGSVKQ